MVVPRDQVGYSNPYVFNYMPHNHCGMGCGRGYGMFGGNSIFGGITRSINNFASDLMTYNWTTFGVNTLMTSLYMIFGGSKYSAGAGFASKYTSNVNNGTAPATKRTAAEILKDLRGYATLQNFGASSTDDLKAKANERKENAKVAYEAAKKKEIYDKDGKQYTYETYIKALNLCETSTDYLLELFKNKKKTPLTAGDLAEIIARTKDKTNCSDLTDDKLYNAANAKSGTDSKALVENVQRTKEEADAAEAAAKEAESLTSLSDINSKVNALAIEYAEAETGTSQAQINKLKKENEQIDSKLKRMEKHGKKDTDKYKELSTTYTNNETTIKAFNDAIEEAKRKMNEKPEVKQPAKPAEQPPETKQPETNTDTTLQTVQPQQTGVQYKIEDGVIKDAYGKPIDPKDYTLPMLKAACGEPDGNGVYKVGDKCYKDDGKGNIVPCDAKGKIITSSVNPKAAAGAATNVKSQGNAADAAKTNKAALGAQYDQYTKIVVDGKETRVRACGTSDNNAYYISESTGQLYTIDQDGNAKVCSAPDKPITVTGTANDKQYKSKFSSDEYGHLVETKYNHGENGSKYSEVMYIPNDGGVTVKAKIFKKDVVDKIVITHYDSNGKELHRNLLDENEENGIPLTKTKDPKAAKRNGKYCYTREYEGRQVFCDGVGNVSPNYTKAFDDKLDINGTIKVNYRGKQLTLTLVKKIDNKDGTSYRIFQDASDNNQHYYINSMGDLRKCNGIDKNDSKNTYKAID